MLASENRLKKRKDFGYIYKNGESVYSKNFVIMHTINKFKKIRVGFSISKKVGKAYIRNKLKRQLRAIVRENISSPPPAKNYVIIPKPSIVGVEYADIAKELLMLFAKINKVSTNDE